MGTVAITALYKTTSMVGTVPITALYKTASVVGKVDITALYKATSVVGTVVNTSLYKVVSMIRKYHNHKPETTPWHREEELLNHHETPRRQKQSNHLSLPKQDDCNARIDIKQCTTKHRTITDSHNGSNNKQKVNNNRSIALEQTAA